MKNRSGLTLEIYSVQEYKKARFNPSIIARADVVVLNLTKQGGRCLTVKNRWGEVDEHKFVEGYLAAFEDLT